MNYTRDQPTEPGHYWFRHESGLVTVVSVEMNGSIWVIGDSDYLWRSGDHPLTGEFAGPIPEPE